jgi:hypothetical protein
MKSRCSVTQATPGDRLFSTLYMIASKTMYDYTSSDRSWCIVGYSMFTFNESNEMEREMCVHLECHV